MPKAEKGSLKDVGKRIKEKGLKKLKFWCEMCQKQCRDANGFKCHLTSDSHLRNMKIFGDNAGSIIARKSAEFERAYVQHLRLRHSNVNVNANHVYNEVIRDKTHVHMNATYWSSLSGFVQHLARKNLVQLEQTEKGWYVKYIPHKDAAALHRDALMEERAQSELWAEQREEQRRQAWRRQLDAGATQTTPATSVDAEHKQVAVAIGKPPEQETSSKLAMKESVLGSESEGDEDVTPNVPAPEPVKERPKKKAKKESKELTPSDSWLHRNILVRIVTQEAGADYFRQKGVVEQVDGYTARVALLQEETVLQLDQGHLDTVIPKVDQKARIVQGPHRGTKATVVSLDKAAGKGRLRLKGKDTVEELRLEDFSAVI